MKTKGRFIGIIAALGLLLSLVSVGTVGAATGKVALDATYYSDKDTFNVVTASVTDADLSATRTGKVRFTNVSGSTTTFAVTAGVIEGELAKTDTFNRAGNDAVQTLTLTKGGTDKDKSGALTVADVALKVNGTAVTPASVTTSSNKITTVVLPAANNDAAGTGDVTVAYQYTEYSGTNTASTPVDLYALQVMYGAGNGNETNQVLAMGVTQSTGTITIGSVPAIPANSEVLITFGYDVADSITKNVTLSSNTSVAAGKNRALTGAETSATSGIFASKVALFTGGDLAKIESESQDSANDLAANGGDADGTVQVDELNGTTGLGTDLNTRVQAASTSLGLTAASTSAANFLKQSLPIADGDSITATYVDASPSATLTKSSTADLAAPVVTLVSPTDKLYTSETLITLSADVVDSGAGVAQTAITMVPPAGNTFNTILQPIQAGFRVSSSPTAAIGEGSKTWFVATKDKVGNLPAKDTSSTTNNADRGAAPYGDASADNAFAFTVDTSGPEVSTSITGLKLKNAGVTTGTTVESQTTDSRTWVRLLFTLGTGGAPIDAASVAASDFTVGGVAPVSVQVNTVAHDSSATAVGSAVYLEVAQMDTDARPKVVVVGEIKDKAGNARTSGTITASADQLSPVLTSTTDVALGQKAVTITVTSSESLVVNPTISITATKPAAGVTANLQAQTVTSVSSTSWTAKVTNAAGSFSKEYIVVTGTDIPGNASTIGDDSPAKDLTSFELDYAAPTVVFNDAGGSALSGTSEEEGAVWIVAVFDEDEYTGDTSKTVTVNTMSLKNDDKVVITDDVDLLFTDDNISFTLAKTLVPDTYTFDMKGTDTAGNAVTATQITFTVTKKVAYSLVLKPGVNLVSIPGTPVGDAGSLNVLFDGLPVTSVTTYDNSVDGGAWLTSTYDAGMGHFMGDITAIEPGIAYFVTTTAKTTAKAMLESPGVALPPTVPLKQGFNAVGFWNIDNATSTADMDAYLSSVKWSVAYTFDPTPGVGWVVIRPDGSVTGDTEAAEGKGYFVYLTADGTLTP